jgi:hypothetical protein
VIRPHPTKGVAHGNRSPGKARAVLSRPQAPIVASLSLRHAWPAPRGFTGSVLIIRWRLRDDGSVWSVVEAIRDRHGQPIPRDRWPYFDDGELQELDAKDRPIRLRGPRNLDTLESWLIESANAHDVTPPADRKAAS